MGPKELVSDKEDGQPWRKRWLQKRNFWTEIFLRIFFIKQIASVAQIYVLCFLQDDGTLTAFSVGSPKLSDSWPFSFLNPF